MDLPQSSFAAQDAFMKANQVINDMGYSKIAVSVSGGSDSDVVVDIITKVDRDKKCHYRYFDTGMDYQATHDHLDYLEERYGITIERVEPVERVAVACKKHGLPVFSKQIAQTIGVLQEHDFAWEDIDEETLLDRYDGMGIVRHVKWWTNGYKTKGKRPSKFTVAHKRLLKEYMIENPPSFVISDKCCTYAKKLTAQREHEAKGYEVDILGVRQAEGGVRANTFTTCFSPNNRGTGSHGYAVYRPLWWFTDEDKAAYIQEMGIVNSECYTRYGFHRTGCALCPFAGSKHLKAEMQAVKLYEPKLYKLAWSVFGPAYEYLEGYEQYKKDHDTEDEMQPRLF